MWIILTCPLIGVCNPIRWHSNASRKQASKAMMKQAAEKVPHLHTYLLMTNVNTFYKMTWKRLKKGMKASTLFHNGSECLSPIWIIYSLYSFSTMYVNKSLKQSVLVAIRDMLTIMSKSVEETTFLRSIVASVRKITENLWSSLARISYTVEYKLVIQEILSHPK